MVSLAKRKKKIKKCYSHVRLFGIDTIADLQINTYICGKPLEKDQNGSLSQWFHKQFNTFPTSIELFLKKFSPLGDVGALAKEFAIYLIDDWLICFDDIERKGSCLDIKNFFGLIASLKEDHNCKVALILNADQLSNADRVEHDFPGGTRGLFYPEKAMPEISGLHIHW